MSKRSRRERREGQAKRALESHDPAFFAKLAQTNPELTAQHLGRLLGELGGAEPSPLDPLAAELCAQLRRGQKLAAARALGAAAAHRSPRLRLEHALAAFALGEDAEAERTANGDPTIAAIMAPLLQVARDAQATAPAAPAAKPPAAEPSSAPLPAEREASAGEPPAGKTATPRGKKAPAAKRSKVMAGSPALVALHSAANAAGAALRGQVRAARLALRRIPVSQLDDVLGLELGAALTIDGENEPHHLTADLRRLCASEVMRKSAAARESLVGTLARWNPEAALDTGKKLEMSAAALRPIQHRIAVSAPPSSATATQAALDLVRTAGAAVFAPEERAAASLYEGFACLRSDRQRAERAFDRAVELGADLVEALRGKLVLAMTDGGEVCRECGAHHATPESGHGVAAAAERFARAVRRLPAGLPFAAAASLIAARGWEQEGNTKAAVAAIQSARELSGGTLSAELDLREAAVLESEQPARAGALLDGLIARDPRDVRPWRMKLELARKANDPRHEAEVLVQAAAATGDPELMTRARAARIRRGELAAFEGLVPGSVTPGALAAEAEPLLSGPARAGELPACALACRAALPPPARLAFDVALIAIEAQHGKLDDAAARFARSLGVWWDSPPLLAKLATTAWLLGLEAAIVPEARRRAHDAKAAPALAALFGAALAANDPLAARQLLALGSASWSRTEVREHKLALGRLERSFDDDSFFAPSPAAPYHGETVPNPEAVRHEIDALLAPEFRIAPADDPSMADEEDDEDFDDLEGFEDFADELADFDVRRIPGKDLAQLDAMLKPVLRTLGLAPSLAQGLSLVKKVELLARLAEIAEAGPSAENMAAMKRAAMKLLAKGKT